MCLSGREKWCFDSKKGVFTPKCPRILAKIDGYCGKRKLQINAPLVFAISPGEWKGAEVLQLAHYNATLNIKHARRGFSSSCTEHKILNARPNFFLYFAARLRQDLFVPTRAQFVSFWKIVLLLLPELIPTRPRKLRPEPRSWIGRPTCMNYCMQGGLEAKQPLFR